MVNSSNQEKELHLLSDVEDLPFDAAASIQGGAAMELYRHPNLKGDRLAAFDGGGVRSMSGNANNQATSVRIEEGRWQFFDLPGWPSIFGRPIGRAVTLGRGTYDFRSFKLDDRVSSFRRVG